MTVLNLTLEERERRAFITNHPAHKMIVATLEARDAADDELRHECDSLKDDLRAANAKIEELLSELEAAPTAVVDPVLA